MNLGIDFGYQYTYIIGSSYSKDRTFSFTSFKHRETKSIKNHAYFKDGKLVFSNLNSIENFNGTKYIANFHKYIQLSFNSQSRLLLDEKTAKNISLNESKEVIFTFKEGDKTISVTISKILKDFFIYLIQKIIRPFNTNNDDIYVVISYPNQYSNKQLEIIKNAAIEAGFKHVKLLSEQIAGILGSYDINLLKNNNKKKFITCNLDSDNIDFCLVEYENRRFNLVEREKATDNIGMDIDEEIAAIYREVFRERNYNLAFQYEQDILNMAFETKKHFSKGHRNSYQKELLGIEFFMDVDTFEELICDPFYISIEKTASVLQSRIDFKKLDALVIGGSNSAFVTFCQKLEHIFNHYTNMNENNYLVYAKGASIWALKSYTTIAHDILSTIIDDTLPKSLPRSIGLKTSIKDLEYPINKIIIPKGMNLPFKTPKKLNMKISDESAKLSFLEGENLLAKQNKMFYELELASLENFGSYVNDNIEFTISIDVNFTVSLNIEIQGNYEEILLKYVPSIDIIGKEDISNKESERLLRMEYKAAIAQKIAKVESYYNSLYSYAIKKKFQEKYDKVIGFRSYIKSDVFDSKKLKDIDAELSKLISKN